MFEIVKQIRMGFEIRVQMLRSGSYRIAVAEHYLRLLPRSTPRRLVRDARCSFAAVRRAGLTADPGFDAKAIDEDIEQPQHAFLPAGLVVQVAHADERAQQVFRADIGADLAGGDGAVQQRADRLGQAIERKGGEFRRALHRKRQRRRHALLGGDELDIGAQPAPQGVDRIGFALQLLGQFAELLHLAPIDGLEQGLAGREVAIERADADAGASRHGLQARVRPAGAEHGLRGLQHALAIAHRVGAGLANGCCGLGLPSDLSRSRSDYLKPDHRFIPLFKHNLFGTSAPNSRIMAPPLKSGGCLRISR